MPGAEVHGAVDIAHEPMECTVARPSPFGYLRGEPAAWAKEVESAHSGRVEEFHQDAGGYRSQFTLGLLIIP